MTVLAVEFLIKKKWKQSIIVYEDEKKADRSVKDGHPADIDTVQLLKVSQNQLNNDNIILSNQLCYINKQSIELHGN